MPMNWPFNIGLKEEVHMKAFLLSIQSIKTWSEDLPGGPAVGSPPASVGDTGLLPSPGRSHMLWGKWASANCAAMNLRSTAPAPQLEKPLPRGDCTTIRELLPLATTKARIQQRRPSITINKQIKEKEMQWAVFYDSAKW